MKIKKTGFTLIELIAVVAILAVLAAVIVPRVITYVHKSKQVAIQSEAKIIFNAAEEAYNSGILVPTKENTYPNHEKPDASPEFGQMKLKTVIKILKDKNLISKTVEEEESVLHRVAVVGWLKEIINVPPENIIVDPDGAFGGFKDE
ncbi:prepilin-type N-terminal cleavage/methylation domain-containing protein [Clostridium sp.]|uniref:prepilin-type N-terminal cleavage/methylation domain-containing protein n=1 Tax=Clostridium sp. TaxID=1506 RepID=UPI002FC8C628